MRMLILPLLFLTLLGSSGCTTTRTSDSADTWMRSELYFGLSRRNAANVTAEEWRAFVLAEVVPAFPGGFTELTAQGFFRDDGKSHQEPVRVLVILNPPDQAAATSRKLDALGRSYCRRFGQDAVLRADSEAKLTFLHAD
jgi:hypothetical protein